MAGPGVFLCDGCVTPASEVITGNLGPDSPVAPWELDLPLDAVLANLAAVAAAGAQAERNLRLWVGRARALGGAWTQIGEALGTTRQSAWERFSGED